MTSSKFSVKKCGRPRCKCCSIIIEYNEKINIGNNIIRINENANCMSKNIIYSIICKACSKVYVGLTTTSFNLRINLHRNHINNNNNRILKVSEHIYECGGNFEATILFQSPKNTSFYLPLMEEYFIKLIRPDLNC